MFENGTDNTPLHLHTTNVYNGFNGSESECYVPKRINKNVSASHIIFDEINFVLCNFRSVG